MPGDDLISIIDGRPVPWVMIVDGRLEGISEGKYQRGFECNFFYLFGDGAFLVTIETYIIVLHKLHV